MKKRPFKLKDRTAHLEEIANNNGGYYYVIIIKTSKGNLQLKESISDFDKANKLTLAINDRGVVDLNFWFMSDM